MLEWIVDGFAIAIQPVCPSVISMETVYLQYIYPQMIQMGWINTTWTNV